MIKIDFKKYDLSSIFIFNNRVVNKITNKTLSLTSNLSPRIKETLLYLLTIEKNLTKKVDTQILSTKQMAIFLNISTDKLNYRLRKLVKNKVIIIVPSCDINNTSKRTSKCYNLADNLNVILAQITQMRELKNIKKDSTNIWTQTKIQLNDKFVSKGFEIRPDQKLIKNIITSPGINLIEQMLSYSKKEIKSIARYIRVTTGKNKSEVFLGRARSYSAVMTPSDLQTLFAIHTLIYEYHKQNIQYYQMQSEMPLNSTPIHIDDIIKLKKAGFGGGTRLKLKNSIESIKNTSFDFYDMYDFTFKTDNKTSAYISKEYKCFNQCSPISSIKSQLKGSDVIFGQGSLTYLIELPDHVFKSILNNTSLLAYPLESLTLKPILFSLYLRIRSLTSKGGIFQESLEKTHQKITYGISLDLFKINLKKEINQIKEGIYLKGGKTIDEVVDIELMGYSVTISYKLDKIYSFCNKERMLSAISVSYKDQKAPTIKNALKEPLEIITHLLNTK